MKRKFVNMYLGAAALLVMGLTAPVCAAETEEVAVETEVKAADVTLDVNGTEIILVNESEVEIASAEATASEEEGAYTVVLTEGENTHTFENVKPEAWTEPKLIEEFGFFYIRYTDAEGNNKEAAEKGELTAMEEEITLWAVGNVNMRAEASADSDIVTVVGLGDECKLIGVYPGWCQITYNDATGFVNHKYLSAEKADADDAVAREEAAVAAAAAAAAQTYSYSYASSGSNGGGGNGGGAPAGEECLVGGLLN